MAHNEHYKHFPPEFEPYKICNNAFCSGNLQQIFQYVARRKHKGNEVQDLKKALDFLEYEMERRDAFMKEMLELEKVFYSKNLSLLIIREHTFPPCVHAGVYILNIKLHQDFIDWCKINDPFLQEVYDYLVSNRLSGVAEILKNKN